MKCQDFHPLCLHLVDKSPVKGGEEMKKLILMFSPAWNDGNSMKLLWLCLSLLVFMTTGYKWGCLVTISFYRHTAFKLINLTLLIRAESTSILSSSDKQGSVVTNQVFQSKDYFIRRLLTIAANLLLWMQNISGNWNIVWCVVRFYWVLMIWLCSIQFWQWTVSKEEILLHWHLWHVSIFNGNIKYAHTPSRRLAQMSWELQNFKSSAAFRIILQYSLLKIIWTVANSCLALAQGSEVSMTVQWSAVREQCMMVSRSGAVQHLTPDIRAWLQCHKSQCQTPHHRDAGHSDWSSC